MIDQKPERGEAWSTYAKRVMEGTRLLRKKVMDKCTEEGEQKWRQKIYEEYAIERLKKAIPEKLFPVQPLESLEEVVTAIIEKEEDESVLRNEWTVVQRKFNQPMYSTPRKQLPQRKEERHFREQSYRNLHSEERHRKDKSYRNPQPRRTEGRWENRPQQRRQVECWKCGELGHISRQCHYMTQSGEKTKTYADALINEPMEVNHIRKRRSSMQSRASTISRLSLEEGPLYRGEERGRNQKNKILRQTEKQQSAGEPANSVKRDFKSGYRST